MSHWLHSPCVPYPATETLPVLLWGFCLWTFSLLLRFSFPGPTLISFSCFLIHVVLLYLMLLTAPLLRVSLFHNDIYLFSIRYTPQPPVESESVRQEVWLILFTLADYIVGTEWLFAVWASQVFWNNPSLTKCLYISFPLHKCNRYCDDSVGSQWPNTDTSSLLQMTQRGHFSGSTLDRSSKACPAQKKGRCFSGWRF